MKTRRSLREIFRRSWVATLWRWRARQARWIVFWAKKTGLLDKDESKK